MNKKIIGNIPLKFNVGQYRKLINKLMTKIIKSTITNRINLLFVSPHDQDQYNSFKKIYPTDPDLSVGYNFIKDIVDKKLDKKFTKHIKNATEDIFTPILNAAIEKALTHKAESLAHRVANDKLFNDELKKE